MSHHNNLKIELQDFKAAKAKLVSDIKELDRAHNVSAKIAKDNEKMYNDAIKENEKLRIQLSGTQKALENVEKHHKEYIKRMKKEHYKTSSELEIVYNQNGMEYEDLKMRAVLLYNSNKENEKISATFKAHAKNYKEQMKIAKDDLVIMDQKYEIIKNHLQSMRIENENLENDISRKNEEISDLSDKRLELFQEKEKLRSDLRAAKGIEIINETSLHNEEQSISDDTDAKNLDDESFENNEKKIQTQT